MCATIATGVQQRASTPQWHLRDQKLRELRDGCGVAARCLLPPATRWDPGGAGLGGQSYVSDGGGAVEEEGAGSLEEWGEGRAFVGRGASAESRYWGRVGWCSATTWPTGRGELGANDQIGGGSMLLAATLRVRQREGPKLLPQLPCLSSSSDTLQLPT